MILWWLACTSGDDTVQQAVPEVTLVEASQAVTFASSEALGAHRLRTMRKQQEYHGEDVRSETTEILLIDWADWDHWQATQMVDDEIVSQVWVVDGRCVEGMNGRFIERNDGEPYRVQLRNTWNQWEMMMRPFVQHVEWTFVQTDIIEDRKTKQYQASFTRPTEGHNGLFPKDLSGNIWVDEQTAVRLLGSVEGVLLNGPYKKTVSLSIERSDIGADVVLERLRESLPSLEQTQDRN